MTSLPITPPKARVDVAPKSSSPPSGAGYGDFAALLNQTTARTAPAEGQQPRPAQSDQPRRRDDDAVHARPADAKDDNSPTATAAAPKPADAPASGEATDPAAKPSDGPPATAAQGDAPAQGQAADAQTAAAAAQAAAAAGSTPPATPPPAAGALNATPAGTGAGTPQGLTAAVAAQAALTAATGATAKGAGAVVADPTAANANAAAAGQLQIPAELLATGKGAGKPAHGKDLKNADGTPSGLPPAPTLPPSANAAAQATPGDHGANANHNGPGAQAQPATPPTVAAGQPTATPLTAVPTAAGAGQLTRGSVVQTAERVQELVHIATTRAGNARATLQLKPEALGQVDVHLRTTRDGLVATIAAHDQAGLDALQNAAAELRRTLSDRGVELHSLDLQLGAGAGDFSNQGDARQASTGRGGGASSYGLDDDVVAEEDLTISIASPTAAGALVDVTA
ncbi:hypothetical protein DSM104299_00047 [Baekduia alba]|uniref:flagellar hook-length control protein FliK n=1 Tax=Baekduia alba TaxID=2997333 RepID=UPI00233FFA0D|nr:flagellar hook-length control protein FliK [Baekduia alba]WCB91376.1 hypothetical protein DSM104299_00047 [Baekduia alba]